MQHIIFDLEATCWDGAPPNDIQEIIEIGAIRLNAYGEDLDQFSELVRPQVNPRLSRYCINLTGIQQAEVDAASTFDHVIMRFEDWIDHGEPAMLYSWGKHDRRLLLENCELYRLDASRFSQAVDLKREYRHLKALSASIGLKKAMKYEGLEFVGQEHRALDDALNLKEIFIRYIDEWQF